MCDYAQLPGRFLGARCPPPPPCPLIWAALQYPSPLEPRYYETRDRPKNRLCIKGDLGSTEHLNLSLDFLNALLEATLAEGLEQTAGYADLCGAAEQYLIIFDRRPETPWETKTWQRNEVWQGKTLGVWGM